MQQQIKKDISTNKTATINSQQKSNQKEETKYGAWNPLTKWENGTHMPTITHTNSSGNSRPKLDWWRDVMATPPRSQPPYSEGEIEVGANRKEEEMRSKTAALSATTNSPGQFLQEIHVYLLQAVYRKWVTRANRRPYAESEDTNITASSVQWPYPILPTRAAANVFVIVCMCVSCFVCHWQLTWLVDFMYHI